MKMRYFVDITPALINKTAIFNIIKDTINYIPDLNSKRLVLGKTYRDKNNFDSPVPRLFFLALKFPKLFVFLRNIAVFLTPKEKRPIFFFDPLYILFYRKLNDAKILILDLTPITHPDWHDSKVAYLYSIAFKILKNDGVICYSISNSTKNELESIYEIKKTNSRILYLYSDKKYIPLTPPAKTKNILFVGSFEPRKNLLGLIKAFQLSQLAEKGYKLHVVGAKTQYFNDHTSSINNITNVIIHGYLPDQELLTIYKNTRIFAYPSFWEGFGVPLLEAINLKIAAFASNLSACPEIGGPFMKYVNPYKTEDISKALKELSNLDDDEYLNYTEKVYAHASQFSIDSYMKNIKNVLGSKNE